MVDARTTDDPTKIRVGPARGTILLSFGLVANLAAQMTFAAKSPSIFRSQRE
jgi:hypothetical protein